MGAAGLEARMQSPSTFVPIEYWDSQSNRPSPRMERGNVIYCFAATGRTSGVTRRMVTRRFSCSGPEVLTFR